MNIPIMLWSTRGNEQGGALLFIPANDDVAKRSPALAEFVATQPQDGQYLSIKIRHKADCLAPSANRGHVEWPSTCRCSEIWV